MRNIIALVLGGGRGTRLYPLTKYRSKPAVPIGGKYRLIDIPISNCINSGLNRVYVLTQFNSVSLHRHIRSTYTFDPFDGGFVEILAAQQTNTSADWYQGTADAVRQNLRYVQQPGVDAVFILSGDQLYRMNFHDMVATHQKSGADVTIAAVPVHGRDAAGLGIMRLDETGRVVGFLEKPKTEEELSIVRTSPSWIDAHGVPSRGRDCLANMGIYLFNRKTLLDVLQKTDYQDFGKEVFPASIRSRRVQVHLFDGYWEDIGTIKSFFEANLGLATIDPDFKLWLPNAPVFTRARFLPPTRIDRAQVACSLIADGSRIEEGAVIENSVIGLRCRIGKNVVIRNSIIMGNDYFDAPTTNGAADGPSLGIGEGTHIENAIVDKNCRIGCHVKIVNDRSIENTEESDRLMICDGIAVVPKEAVLPDRWSLQDVCRHR
jgi:glucose-1-phosphate adenylyltransferase